jgi:hypothetical protein
MKRTFEEYIKNPAAKVPGTKMIFSGIKNEQQVKDLWAYISQFDSNGIVKSNAALFVRRLYAPPATRLDAITMLQKKPIL